MWAQILCYKNQGIHWYHCNPTFLWKINFTLVRRLISALIWDISGLWNRSDSRDFREKRIVISRFLTPYNKKCRRYFPNFLKNYCMNFILNFRSLRKRRREEFQNGVPKAVLDMTNEMAKIVLTTTQSENNNKKKTPKRTPKRDKSTLRTYAPYAKLLPLLGLVAA